MKILELGQAIAGLLAATLLAWFGAGVAKAEPPVMGDPLQLSETPGFALDCSALGAHNMKTF